MTLKTEAKGIIDTTNRRDINMIRALEEGIENFAGCAVIISHDRWFLMNFTHILAFENDSTVYWFEGTIQNTKKIERNDLAMQNRKGLAIENWSINQLEFRKMKYYNNILGPLEIHLW